MDTPITGLHHVTATVAEAQPDIDFFVGTLGLRLVKRTVNFDNHDVYHFYYGDERGLPGTLYTTFPYAGKGVRQGVHGTGQVTVTAFSVPADSLDAWRARLEEDDVPAADATPRFGQPVVTVADPSGLVLELIAAPADVRAPWTGAGADPRTAVRGLHSVTLAIREPEATIRFLADVLGWGVVGEEGARTRLATGGRAPGHYIDVLHAPDAPAAVNGVGTVHHVAMGIAGEDAQLALREKLLVHGRHVTEVRDRQYFRSIYFREPGGVLYEVATLGPGFPVDEPVESLGEALKLPPWEEPARARIEAALPEIRMPVRA